MFPSQPNERVRKGSLSYVRRDGSSTHVTLNHTGENLPQVSVGFCVPYGSVEYTHVQMCLHVCLLKCGESVLALLRLTRQSKVV